MECPICMDDIDVNKNSVTTDCGHCFHTSCLMHNVSLNGYCCPCCRASMADEPPLDDDDSSDDSYDDEDDEDYILRGFRFFNNNLNGCDHSEDDVIDENDDETDEQKPPTFSYITQKLQEKGFTYEQLVQVILNEHDEYNDDYVSRFENKLHGSIRRIIINYGNQPSSL